MSYQHKLTNAGNGPDSFSITATPPSGWAYSLQPPAAVSLASRLKVWKMKPIRWPLMRASSARLRRGPSLVAKRMTLRPAIT